MHGRAAVAVACVRGDIAQAVRVPVESRPSGHAADLPLIQRVDLVIEGEEMVRARLENMRFGCRRITFRQQVALMPGRVWRPV